MPFDFTPTQEQQDAIEMAQLEKSFKTVAFAGAGKTTTLKLISDALKTKKNGKSRRGLYVAFNKAIATEAKSNFPNHVDCRTFHSLAFRHVDRRITQKLSLPKLTPAMMAKKMGLSAVKLRKKTLFDSKNTSEAWQYHNFTASQQGALVAEALARFCQTHANYPAPRHFNLPEWLHPDDAAEFRTHLFPALEKRWHEACTPSDDSSIGHDIYLKLWALGKPELPTDFVLFDEAQDADPLMLGILLEQKNTQVIYVGDAHQQIYGWRGATNAMKKLPLPETKLTQSFRFGKNIADVANVLLNELNENTPLRGAEHKDSHVSVSDLPYKNAVLCRTNAGALSALLNAIREDAHVIGKECQGESSTEL